MLFTGAALLALLFSTFSLGDIVNRCQSSGMFAMTWDEGPADHTGALLDILSKKNVRTTFHLTTQYLTDPNVQSMIKRIAGGGHLIGFRTDPSWDMFNMSDDQIKSAIARSANVMSNFIGYYPKFTRLPYKGWDDRIVKAVESTGLVITNHNIETYDYTGDGDRIFNAFQLSISLKGPGGNFISVQRDSIQASVGVTGKVIDLIKSNGFRFVTLDQCLGMSDMTKNKEPLKGADGKVAMGPIPEGEITFKNGAKSSGSSGPIMGGAGGDMGADGPNGVEGKSSKNAAESNTFSSKLILLLTFVYAILF